MKRDKVPQPSAQIQRLAPRLPVKHLLLLVRARDHGSEGLAPVDDRECPYYQQHASASSCISGSGGSICGGFFGTTADGYTQCGWVPRWTMPGQIFVVMPEDVTQERPHAGWN